MNASICCQHEHSRMPHRRSIVSRIWDIFTKMPPLPASTILPWNSLLQLRAVKGVGKSLTWMSTSTQNPAGRRCYEKALQEWDVINQSSFWQRQQYSPQLKKVLVLQAPRHDKLWRRDTDTLSTFCSHRDYSLLAWDAWNVRSHQWKSSRQPECKLTTDS